MYILILKPQVGYRLLFTAMAIHVSGVPAYKPQGVTIPVFIVFIVGTAASL